MARYTRDINGNLMDDSGNYITLNPYNQAAFDVDGTIIHPDDIKKSESDSPDRIVDESNGIIDTFITGENENSLASREEDNKREEYLAMIKNFDLSNFVDELSSNTDIALKILLEMQSNSSPLKRGGDSIAFMADALILATRNMFSSSENTLFDVLSAKVSSYPEDKTYKINVKDFVELLPQTDRKYANKILQSATESIKNKNSLVFYPTPDKALSLSWYDVLAYTKPEKVDAYSSDDYIVFVPTKIFKMLLISSTVMHGAHYKISVSAQFTGYVRKLFYFLESRKNYREFPNATKGVLTISLEELQYLLDFPESYKAGDVKKNILNHARKELNEAKGIDFSFDYEDKKIGRKIVGFVFYISDLSAKALIDTNIVEGPVINEKVIDIDPDKVTVSALLQSLSLSEQEIEDVYNKYKKNKRDLVFFSQAIAKVSTNPSVENKAGYLCTIMDKGITSDFIPEKKKNTFSNFDQRNYDADELEKMMLNSNN